VPARSRRGSLTPEALAFVAICSASSIRDEWNYWRPGRNGQDRIAAGELPDFLEETRTIPSRIRTGALLRRRQTCSIAGSKSQGLSPKDGDQRADSGARIFMADFEDSNSPHLAELHRGASEPDRCRRSHHLLDTGESSTAWRMRSRPCSSGHAAGTS